MNLVILKDRENIIREYNDDKYIVDFYTKFNRYGEWRKKYYILLHWLWVGERLTTNEEMTRNYSRMESDE